MAESPSMCLGKLAGGFSRGCVAVALFCLLGGCGGADTRPVGDLDDVMELRNRDDLNVLFILVDTLRADRLGAYGYERDTTPHIDEFAETGVLFREQLAQSSWTKCSMASLWTGLYPNRAGVLRAQHALPEEARLPAEILRDAGFRTAGIFRNGWVARNFGFAQGFEIYQMPVLHRSAAESIAANPGYVMGSDEDVIGSASEFLKVHADERWFLYLHLLDVHQYASDEESTLFGTRYSDIYDNAIHWTDRLIGRVLDDLDRLGIRDRTLVVFASDHGEAFGEHGAEGHARDVYGEVTETPLILSFPFRLEPGIIVETRSENVDIWPTILDLLGLDELDDPDGHSLVPDIMAAGVSKPTPEEPTTAIAQIDGTWGQLREDPAPIVALSDGNWRLIYRGSRPDRLELFNKQSDPAEQRNLALEDPLLAQELADTVVEYLSRTSAPWGESPMVEIDEMQLRQLRAIGYGVSAPETLP